MGLGIVGARRLMDRFDVESRPARARRSSLQQAAAAAARRSSTPTALGAHRRASSRARRRSDPLDEVQRAEPGAAARARGAARSARRSWRALNRELEDTNRGVVALYAELDEKADHLRRADELKSRFLSNMSHEFRTPLNSILALSAPPARPHATAT